MKWKAKLIADISRQLQFDAKWENTVNKILNDSSIGIHLAIFKEPFLSLVLNGTKKIESRFSRNMIGPYQRIKRGDVVILKASGGPVVGVFVAGEVHFFHNLDKVLLKHIEAEFGEQICSKYDEDFWKDRVDTNYASLIEVKKVKKIAPFKSDKKDRSGWSILRAGHASLFAKVNK